MIKQIAICLTAAFFLSCNHTAVNTPTDKEIEEAIREMYEYFSSKEGGGNYHLNSVEVLEKKPAKEDGRFIVKIKASGTYVNPPLAAPKPDEDYSDTREVELVNKNGRWTWVNPGE